MVLDEGTGAPVSGTDVLLVPVRYQFNPADSISLWRREIAGKTDAQGGFTVQDSDFLHPTRAGRATEVGIRICKVGYWPVIDALHARLVFISFLKPADLPTEFRLRRTTTDEYMSGEYYRALHRCPETEQKKAYVEAFIPAEARRLRNGILSNDSGIILTALRETGDSPVMSSGGPHAEAVLAATGKILAHKDPAVRIAACRVLADYNSQLLSAEIVQNLLALLVDASAQVRTVAGGAIVAHGKEAMAFHKPSILALLRQQDSRLQDLALKATAKFSAYQRSERNRKGGDPEIVAALRSLLYRSPDAEQVNTLLFTLDNLGHDKQFQDLVHLYPNPDTRIQANALTMMRFGTGIADREKALPYFIEALRSANASVRQAAIAGIDRLGDTSQIAVLEEILRIEKEPFLRRYMRETISRLKKTPLR